MGGTRTREEERINGTTEAFLTGVFAGNSSGRRGATLLEVLVVAVILLVGIYSVIRVFPKGFDLVDRSGQMMMARRYAQRFLGEIVATPENIPLGILPSVCMSTRQFTDLGNTESGSYWPVNAMAVQPEDPRGNRSAATAAGDAGLRGFGNALVQYRKIYQETAVLSAPIADYFDGVTGPPASHRQFYRYAVKFAPLQFGTKPPSAAWEEMVTVYSLDKVYHDVDADDPAVANMDGYYELEASGGANYLRFPPYPRERWFKVDYAVGGPDGGTVLDMIVRVPASVSVGRARTLSGGAEATLGSSANPYIPDSARIRRIFRHQFNTSPGGTSPAPSEWCFSFEPSAYPIDPASDSGVVGALRFNATPDGVDDDGVTAGARIGIDYAVLDWSILHDDVDVAGQGSPLTVRLSVPFLSLSDLDDSIPSPLLIQNLDITHPWYGSVTMDPNTYDVPDADAKRGRVKLDVAALNSLWPVLDDGGNVVNRPVRRVRIFYRSVDGYVAMPVKPFAAYQASGQPGCNQYMPSAPPNGNQVSFAWADVGKTVAIDHTNTATGEKVCGETYVIPQTAGVTGYPMVTVNAPGNACTIDAVRGVSLDVRVGWLGRGELRPIGDILAEAWSGGTPDFWGDDGRGRFLWTSVSSVGGAAGGQ